MPKKLKPLSHKQYERRLDRLRLPGPANARVVYELPEGWEWPENEHAGVVGDTIYAPYGLDRTDAAHEAFHVMQQRFTDADRALLMKRLGKTGAWDAAGRSPHEVAANWYQALVAGVDPGRQWTDSYYTPTPPKRRQLLRFAKTLDRLGARYELPGYQRPR